MDENGRITQLATETSLTLNFKTLPIILRKLTLMWSGNETHFVDLLKIDSWVFLKPTV